MRMIFDPKQSSSGRLPGHSDNPDGGDLFSLTIRVHYAAQRLIIIIAALYVFAKYLQK